MKVQVRLSGDEVQLGAVAGVQRSWYALERGDPWAKAKDFWQQGVLGCLAELALAKYLGVYWTGLAKVGANDVGRYEVRTTAWDNGCLMLQPKDRDEAQYVLVTGSRYLWTIHGWCYGYEGKREEWWKVPTNGYGPCFNVPQDALRPLDVGLPAGYAAEP